MQRRVEHLSDTAKALVRSPTPHNRTNPRGRKDNPTTRILNLHLGCILLGFFQWEHHRCLIGLIDPDVLKVSIIEWEKVMFVLGLHFLSGVRKTFNRGIEFGQENVCQQYADSPGFDSYINQDWCYIPIIAILICEGRNQKFRVNFSYMGSQRPEWTIQLLP